MTFLKMINEESSLEFIPSNSYTGIDLDQNELNNCPYQQAQIWMNEAQTLEPFAAILSTVDLAGFPSSRTVLIKKIDPLEGFLFFTNYYSQKAKDLEHNPHAALTFYWQDTPRQLNIKGSAKKCSQELSEKYFSSRPFESQVASYSSRQSQVVTSREELDQAFQHNFEKFKHENKVPYPNFWGGFWLKASSFQFWQGRKHRLHDRFIYEPFQDHWQVKRLYP